jgi:hypothetical protein
MPELFFAEWMCDNKLKMKNNKNWGEKEVSEN